MSERGRDWCWQHLKSMWILCHCILSAQPLASTASQHSSCCSPSPSLSERISHPLLLQLLTASFLTSIPFLRFYPTFQLLPCSSSHFLSFLFCYRFFLPWTFNAWFPCPIVSLLHLVLFYCCRHLLPPSYSNLTHLQRRLGEKMWAKFVCI